MGSRLFWQIPVKRRKNASRISRPCTMHTSMPNKRDLGVLSVRTVYKRRGSATTLPVALNLFVESLRRNPIESRQVVIQDHLLPTDERDGSLDSLRPGYGHA